MSCIYCHGSGCAVCVLFPTATPKPVAVKAGELYAGRCKRCRGEALRVSKAHLDKLELFCKLCGETQEVKR